jgi:hypothetical protein
MVVSTHKDGGGLNISKLQYNPCGSITLHSASQVSVNEKVTIA